MEQDERGVRSAYDEVAGTYADYFPSTEPEKQIELEMITHFASLLPAPRKTLDAGCGAGRMLPELARRGCSPVGIDLSSGMIGRAGRDHGSYPSTVGSLTALPYRDAEFDGYFSWYSTIHSADPEIPTILREAYRVLRPGGFVLIAFQHGDGIADVSYAYRRFGHDITLHRHNRTADYMSDQLARAGFRESARLVRSAVDDERTDQAVLTATK